MNRRDFLLDLAKKTIGFSGLISMTNASSRLGINVRNC